MTADESQGELEGIAIIGMAGRFPGAPNVGQFWDNLKNGVDSIASLTEADLDAAGVDPVLASDPKYVRRYGALDRIEWFDAPFFRMTPREARLLDPQQRALLECAWEALEHAGHAPSQYEGDIGVYAGMGAATYLLSNILTSAEIRHPADLPAALIANEKDFVASRIAHRLDLRGPALTIQTACSTSLVAISTACLNLLTHQCDMALAGGATIAVPQRGGYLYQEGSILSPEGTCRAFDADARGAVGGSGAALVVLKRHQDAVNDGDTVYAVIHGFALNNDGAGKASFTAPSVDGQAQAITKALAMAGFDARTIGYVEAHGTGTAIGDPIEVQALTDAFRASSEEAPIGTCALASLKTNVGHLDAAAGAAGLIKAAFALHERVIPPSLHFEHPNPAIDFAASPFYVSTALTPWRESETPRRAGVSSFGVGGTNAHVVLEEAPPRLFVRAGRPVHLLPISAKTRSARDRMAASLADALEQNASIALDDAAFTLQRGREPFPYRSAVVATTRDEAIRALREPDESIAVDGSGLDTVMLFPGQGSQHVGMARALYETEAVFRAAVDRCASALASDFDLAAVVFAEPSEAAEAELARPSRVQLALFTIEYALAQLWIANGVRPGAMIGHSVGEYVAACVAGVFSLEDAVAIVARRGALVEALPPGAMLAVPLAEADVRARLVPGLEIAAVNAPLRTVVAGSVEAIDAFAAALAADRIDAKRLPVPRAYHSAMLDGVLSSFASAFDGITLHAPRIPIVSNVTGTWLTDADAIDPAYWTRHLRRTVRFADGITTLLSRERDGKSALFLEVGPSQTLRTFVRASIGDRHDVRVVSSLPRARGDSRSALEAWSAAVGQVWAAGGAVDWKAFTTDVVAMRVPLPTYPFEREYHWIEAGKRGRPSLHEDGANDAEPSSSASPASGDPATELTATESLVARAWREILGLKRIPRAESFFDLGGDSLMASQLIARINDAFRLSLPLREIFEHPTLAGIAARIDAGADALLGGLAPRGTIPSSARSAPILASYAQQRLWFEDKIEPGSAAYTMPGALRIEGALDVPALRRALLEITRRHEALRTTFAESAEGATLVIHDAPESFDLAVDDVRPDEVERIAREDAIRPFALENGPLLRARLLRTGAETHVLLLAMHHIVSDGWSVGVLVREIGALYASYRAGAVSPLAALPIQFADYAAWQREPAQRDAMDAGVAHFAASLKGAQALALPCDRPRPPAPTYRGTAASFTVPHAIVSSLDALAKAHGATRFMVLLAAYDVLLARLSGCDDVTVGTPVANRPRPELEPLIGFFVNTIALRADLADDPTFASLLARVRDASVSAFAHQSVPFERVVQAVDAPRDMSRSPIFQTMFVLQNAPAGPIALDGLVLSPIPHTHTTSKLDLTWSMQESEGELHGSVEYATDLFDAETIVRWASHFVCLLESIVRAPDARVHDLAILRDDEARHVVTAWHGAALAVPDRCIHALFEDRAKVQPNAVAVEAHGESLTYAALDARANRLAARLRAVGVGAGAKVAIAMTRGADMIASMLAVLKTGAAYLPLDLEYPADRLVYALRDADARHLMTRAGDRARLPSAFGGTIVLADDPSIDRESAAKQVDTATPDSVAYVIYTSGSTGNPKGVAIAHRNASSFVGWADATFARDEMARVLASTSICFDLSIFEIFAVLACGGTVVVVENALALSEDHAVTLLNTVPSAMAALLDAGPLPRSVKTVNLAGEPLTRVLADRVYREPDVARVLNLYGPTETTTYSSFAVVPRGESSAPTLGRPIANTQIYLLDPQRRPVPLGVAGEIWIGGAGVTIGYLGRPDLTAARYADDPFLPGNRMYRTGDRGRALSSGEIEYLGRLDHQVKLRGYRIELGELEAILAATPGVSACAVVMREDVSGDPRLVAYVVGSADAAQCRAALAAKVPAYMVPASFVALAAMPLTPNGKVDRKALPSPAIEPEEARYTAPTNDTEVILASIVAEVLGVDRVGIDDSFFDRGGHSLSAMRVVTRVREQLGKVLPLRALFEDPTVRGLARSIGGASDAEPITLRAPRVGPIPASHAQRRLWILDQLAPGRATYNVAAALRLSGALAIDALRAAVDAVVVRHESLRTTFAEEAGEVVQRVGDAPRSIVTLDDLASFPDPEAVAHARAQAEAARPFSLTDGPLFRARLLRLGDREHVLLVTMHHIVSDGWSIGILVREVAALYEAFVQGKTSPLPDLPLQFADYALWQRDAGEEERIDRAVVERAALLSGSAPLELPLDRPRPPLQGYAGATIEACIPAPLAQSIRALAKTHGATLFMVLVAAYDVFLSRLTGQTDITIGTPIANRSRADVEPLIGFFVNTLVLRADLEGAPRFVDHLAGVRAACLDAFRHEDVPFERLVDALGVTRDPSRSPVFQTMFALQNAPLEALRLGDLSITPIRQESGTSKLDMSFSLRELPEGDIAVSVEYATDLFDRTTIERWLGHFVSLLESIARAPEARVVDLSMLRPAERAQIVDGWKIHASQAPFQSVPSIFASIAARQPNAVALVFERESLTYAELNARANRLAHRLVALGAKPDDLVAIALERSAESIVAVLGVLKAGAAYLPLDPSYPQDRLDYMLADSKAALLVTSRAMADRFARSEVRAICVDAPHEPEASDANPAVSIAAHHLAYAIYTSGSTGRPKGVLLEHGGLTNLARAQTALFGPPRRVLQFASPSFDASVWEIVMALASGATLHVARRETILPGADLIAYAREHRIDRMTLPPSALAVMTPEALSDVTTLILAGEACPEGLAARWSEGRHLWNAYGPTETTVCATAGEWSSDAPHFTIGRPIANARVYVLDGERAPVPIGVVGEIYVGGAGVARGYVERDDLTRDAFVTDPFATEAGARMYATGDRGRFLADGRLEFLGRADAQVKVRGYRIEPGEIEAVLVAHPSVRAASVIVREDVPGDARLVAYVIGDVTLAALRDHMGLTLPAHMVPAAIVVLDALPLTPNGKVDTKALPRPERAEAESAVAPRTEDERVLARIWAGVLGLEVGVKDDLFALGATSLGVVRAAHAARAELNLELPVQLLFAESTIEAQALAIARVRAGVASAAAIDWARETSLDLPAVLPPRVASGSDVIGLTGATGFLGSFLLADLLALTDARICCFVRARSVDDGMRRIRESLAHYGLLDEAKLARVEAVPSDLAQPRLGLAQRTWDDLASRLTAIVHNGAHVDGNLPYPLLRAANVDATRAIVALATRRRTIPIHYVSTLSVLHGVAPSAKVGDSMATPETTPLENPAGLQGGYAESKWCAERVLEKAAAAGVPVAIYRPGRITGDSRTGASSSSDLPSLFLKGCTQLGAMPRIRGSFNAVPVDYVAGAIVRIAMGSAYEGKTFHLSSPKNVTWDIVFAALDAAGYTVAETSYADWRRALLAALADGTSSNAALTLTDNFPEVYDDAVFRAEAMVDCRQATAALGGAFECPPVTLDTFTRYVDWMIGSGFLASPRIANAG